MLARRFEKYRGKHQYDAVVGLSGGKDSTYVLCQIVNKYKLKVAAVTYDNGFLTDFAKESIKNTVNKLGVVVADHIGNTGLRILASSLSIYCMGVR